MSYCGIEGAASRESRLCSVWSRPRFPKQSLAYDISIWYQTGKGDWRPDTRLGWQLHN